MIGAKLSNILYIVATPIGNLADLSFRAVEVLRGVAVIAAEDTRHSGRLLRHYGIDTPMLALHDHNEREVTPQLIRRLQQGASVALISDAGTPLVSDPGYRLVREAHAAGISVSPIPGPCALVAALSVAGVPPDRFVFEGFLPRTSAARQALFREWVERPLTLIFYEASHRIAEALADLRLVYPAERPVVIARELTKLHETIVSTTAGGAPALLDNDPQMCRGEFVVLVEGALHAVGGALDATQQRVLRLLLEHCPLRTAADLAAEITGASRKLLYQEALAIRARAKAPDAS